MPVLRSTRSTSRPVSPRDASRSPRGSASPVDLKPYWYRLIPGEEFGAPFKTFYTTDLEFKISPDPTVIPMPTNPRPPPLSLKDFECTRTLGSGQGQVLMVSSKRRSYQLDSGSIFALKATPRKEYRTDAATLACHGSKNNLEIITDFVNRHLFAKDRERNTLVYLDWNPFVAGLIQVFEDSHMLYMAMEFIPGGTLRSLLKRANGGLSPRDTNFYFGNIVCALEFLHKLGIVHRDLKPENILINGDGYLCLTDFGEATFFTYRDPKRKVVGTSFYMAPEYQFTSKYDPSDRPMAVDWWSSGCILYEMITGKLAFFGETSLATQIKSAKGMAAMQWPSSIKFGKNLKSLISRLLELDPRLRLGQDTEHVKCDPWLSNIDWSKMQRRRYLAPFMPKLIDTSELWHDSPLPKQEHVPGLMVVEPPLHLAHDNRYPERRERAL